MVKDIVELIKSVVIAIIAAVLIITFVFETVSVDGQSMSPTLTHKDRLIIEKVTYYFRKPKPNDIVVIKYPADTREKFIKRVVAVAGDKVKVEDNRLFINGVEKDEPYLKEKFINGFYNEVTVPENTIFVLGDNRNNSKDSRSPDVGFVNLKLVVGKSALRIYPFNKIGRTR
ncbi:signal peptidase I [Clostridium swellfunianum]|uniref:signal peptidase I n=1 Tax=Clostridium swellfunianum TaxID=1367462 RepID=UPI00202E45ED|nr:signal peptidase I [Clostridium swellfunianum]MCM0648692.1 signal peptidase I [Clostridium swellfunianum]